MPLTPCTACGRSHLGRDAADPERCAACRARQRRRQLPRTTHPADRPPNAPKQRRACLRCDQAFWSWGIDNRLCETCRTHNGINEMDPPLCGMALISHHEVSASDPHVTTRRRVP